MDEFVLYLEMGWQHIIAWEALDHILFMIALVCLYEWKDRFKVVVLVTAFTIGHALTLILSAKQLVLFNSNWVEFFIPVTIAITALFRLLSSTQNKQNNIFAYAMALVFGLIHGMGFANTIRMMLLDEQSIVWPLLGFNLGVEAGQLVVALSFLLLSWVAIARLGLSKNIWRIAWATLAMVSAVYFCIERWPAKEQLTQP
jgi:uncharacterized protein YebE (UPF0316 family)